MRDPLRVCVSGPLEPLASGFAAELRGLGYKPVSAVFQLQLMAHVSRWLADEGLSSHDLTADAVRRFVTVRRAAGYTNYSSDRAMAPMLRYLRGIGRAPAALVEEPGTPTELLLERYRVYLTIERGLTMATARGYVDAVRPFLAGRAANDGLDLEHLTAGEVTAFVVARCPGQARGSAKMTVRRCGRCWAFCTSMASSRGRLSGLCRRWRRGGWPGCRERSSPTRCIGCWGPVIAARRAGVATSRS